MHSTWSDGSQTLEDIVAAGIARGYEYCGVTDHSYGLPIAGGVSMARLAEQHREIDRAERAARRPVPAAQGHRGEHPRRRHARHDARRTARSSSSSSPRRTRRCGRRRIRRARMLTAVRTPGVHILGHPRGRMYGSRPGVTRRLGRVFEAAARRGRRDRDRRRSLASGHRLRARARGARRRLPLRARQRRARAERAARTPRPRSRTRGWRASPPSASINCWPLDRLLDWLRR